MVGLVLISHSRKITDGIKELVEQMVADKVKVVSAGGLDESTLGTSVEGILNGINSVYDESGVLLLVDLGSAVLSAKEAIEFLDESKQNNVVISNAPLVEGSFIAAIEASTGKTLVEVNNAAEGTKELNKLG